MPLRPAQGQHHGQPLQKVLGIGRRGAVLADDPAIPGGLAAGVSLADLVAGHGRGGVVEQDRPPLGVGKARTHGVGAHARGQPAERRHQNAARLRIDVHQPHQPGRGHHLRVGAHPPHEIEVAHAHRTESGLPALGDGQLGGPRGPHAQHWPRRCGHDGRGAEQFPVAGHLAHAVGVVAGQVGLHQQAGRQRRVSFRHGGRLQALRRQGAELIGRE